MKDEFEEAGQLDDDRVQQPARRFLRKYPWAMVLVAMLFVVVPFLSWYGTWFGRPLSDSGLTEYLNDSEKPRHVQQALEQIVGRINHHDKSASQWYPRVAQLAHHPVAQVREMAAWAMQYDDTFDGFHGALLFMLNDPDPLVRHQSALSLVSFGDATGRQEIVAMLKPYALQSPIAGKATAMFKEGDAVAANAPVVRIEGAGGKKLEVKTAQAGRVERVNVVDGAEVTPNQEVVILSPSIEQVWEALRALYIVGRPEDINAVQQYTLDLPGMPDRVRQQAAATTDAIRSRAQQPAAATDPIPSKSQ